MSRLEMYQFSDVEGIGVEIAPADNEALSFSAWWNEGDEGPIAHVPRDEVVRLTAWLIAWLANEGAE